MLRPSHQRFRLWVQVRLKDLRAKEAKHPCNEASTVSKEEEQSYKEGLAEKLAHAGSLPSHAASLGRVSCVVHQAAVKTLLHRSEPTATWC